MRKILSYIGNQYNNWWGKFSFGMFITFLVMSLLSNPFQLLSAGLWLFNCILNIYLDKRSYESDQWFVNYKRQI